MPTPEQITALRFLASSRCGVFTRMEAYAHGWTPSEVDALVRSGAWVSCGWGSLAIGAPQDLIQAHARACWGRLLRLSGDVVVSHESAGFLFELPYVEPPSTPTLTRVVLDGMPRPHRLGAAAVPPEHRVQTYGFSSTSGPRTLVDLLRNAKDPCTAQALADGGARIGLDAASLGDVLAFSRGWPGLEQARAAIAFAEPKCESPLESWVRVWLRAGGLPAPTPQFTVMAGKRFVGRVDFCFEQQRVVIECDGQIKYRPGSSWTASPSETLWKEKLREDDVRAEGFEVVRAYAKDGKDDGADLCRRVIRAMERSALHR